MKRMKKVSLLALVLVFTLVLAACGGGAKTDGKVTLTLATWANEEEGREIDELLGKLNETSNTYEIKQQIIPKDYYVKIQTQVAGNQAPDLFWLAQEYLPAYMETGTLVALDEMLAAQSKIDMADFYPEILATAQRNGDTYGLPWIDQPYVVYYNKALVNEADVQGWTWNDFIEISNNVKTNDVYGFASTGNPPPEVFIWGEGGEVINTDGSISLDSPETLAGLETMNRLMSAPGTMPFNEASSNGVETAFVNGKVAMMIGGATDDVELKVSEGGAPFEVGMAIMPAGSKKHVTFSWNASTVIAEQTENKEVAFEALTDLTLAMFDYKTPAPVKSKSHLVGEINPLKAYAEQEIIGSLEIARGFNNQPKQNELSGAMWDELTLPILSGNDGKGNVDVPALVDNTLKRWETILG